MSISARQILNLPESHAVDEGHGPVERDSSSVNDPNANWGRLVQLLAQRVNERRVRVHVQRD